jgi:hypothetical protein
VGTFGQELQHGFIGERCLLRLSQPGFTDAVQSREILQTKRYLCDPVFIAEQRTDSLRVESARSRESAAFLKRIQSRRGLRAFYPINRSAGKKMPPQGDLHTQPQVLVNDQMLRRQCHRGRLHGRERPRGFCQGGSSFARRR